MIRFKKNTKKLLLLTWDYFKLFHVKQQNFLSMIFNLKKKPILLIIINYLIQTLWSLVTLPWLPGGQTETSEGHPQVQQVSCLIAICIGPHLLCRQLQNVLNFLTPSLWELFHLIFLDGNIRCVVFKIQLCLYLAAHNGLSSQFTLALKRGFENLNISLRMLA